MGSPIPEGECGWTAEIGTPRTELCRCEGGSLYCGNDACPFASSELGDTYGARSRSWQADILNFAGLPANLGEWRVRTGELLTARDYPALERHFGLLRYGALSGYPIAARYIGHFLDCRGAPTPPSFDALNGDTSGLYEPPDRRYPEAIPFSELRGPAYWRAVAIRRRTTSRVQVGSWLSYGVTEDARLALGRFWVTAYADFITRRDGRRLVRLEYQVTDRYDWDPERFGRGDPNWIQHAAGQDLVAQGLACEFDVSFSVREELGYEPGSSPCHDLLVCLDNLGGAGCTSECPPGGVCDRIRSCMRDERGGIACFNRECYDVPRVCTGAQTCFRSGGGFACFTPSEC